MSRRSFLVVGAAVIGFLGGALTIASLAGGSASHTTEPPTTSGVPPETTGAMVSTSRSAAPEPASWDAAPEVLLVWTSGGLVADLESRVSRIDGVVEVSMVRGDELRLVTVTSGAGEVIDSHDDGWSIPLDVLAVDPGSHAPFVEPGDVELVGSLGPGEALLSHTSAGLRGVGPGAILTLATGDISVRGVIDDLSAAGAEVIVDRGTGLEIGAVTDRFLLVAHEGPRDLLQTAIVTDIAALGAPAPVRFRARGETTWLRHGDAVLPLALVKDRFGEFAVRERAGREVEVDPGWVADHIVDADLPILGAVRCHRAVIEPLRRALTGLVNDAIAHVVDPEEYGGCFVPRRIGTGLPLSRHSWGVALDLNVGDNPRGSFTTQDARLVEAMRSAGFGWGGTWLVPDPAHYEAIAVTSVE